MGSFTDLSDYGHGGYKVVVVASVLILMQSLMVCGRLLSRHLQKAMLAADDYILFIATTIGFGLCALAIAFPRIAAYGTHIEIMEQGTIAGQVISLLALFKYLANVVRASLRGSCFMAFPLLPRNAPSFFCTCEFSQVACDYSRQLAM